MPNLYIMCGLPGSGKSTWIKNHIKPGTAVISRDAIRFSLLGENDAYFSKEKLVEQTMYDWVNGSLSDGRDVVLDQTSTSLYARRKILKNITGYDKIGIIWVKTPFEEALKRNDGRKGRAYVPYSSMLSMRDNFIEPSLDEGFDFIFKYENDKMTWKGNIK